ncbi:hypothetical protein GCM10010174_81990 [Kutzneria viridogrisea]|uniref:LppM domain-containing protein n=2 Tax=Kutzneria TaxID=43356 RepID=W5WHK3_9PSEU|nr:DUF3153 domain-containing protein [Kutzneria albida]AHI00087.1 hypothetical protein KALB_6728 [Kutzneria albida DSM 43870]MBA8925266.1 hypothetical protein [Kutzneria viridogrisea]
MYWVTGRKVLLRTAVAAVLVAALSGCVRMQATMVVSPDYKVSGTVVAASVPTSPTDRGPQLSIPGDLGDQVLIQPYSADGYVGTQLSFSGLDFDQVTNLVNGSSPVRGSYALSVRRVGDVVAFTGSVDLSKVPAQRCDVRISVTFPAEPTSATGSVSDTTVNWQPKAGAVTALAATSDLSTLATAEWLRWSVLVAGVLVASVAVVGGLAVLAHRRALRARRVAATRR